jgi:hypothetical protein
MVFSPLVAACSTVPVQRGRVRRWGFPRWVLFAHQYPPRGGVLGGGVFPVACRLLNSTRPKGVLDGGVTSVGCRLLNSTRPKEACSAVVLSPLGIACSTLPAQRRRVRQWCYLRWVSLAQHYPSKGGVLGGGVISVGCRLLNSTRPKEACSAGVLFPLGAACSTVPVQRRRARRWGYLRWVPLAQQYPSPSVITSERHIAERSNPVGKPRALPSLDCFTLRVRNDVGPLAQRHPSQERARRWCRSGRVNITVRRHCYPKRQHQVAVRRLETVRHAGSTAACRWCSLGISTRYLNSTVQRRALRCCYPRRQLISKQYPFKGGVLGGALPADCRPSLRGRGKPPACCGNSRCLLDCFVANGNYVAAASQ